jgi:hypothetical protein
MRGVEFLSEIVSFVVGALGGSLITYHYTKKSFNASGRSTVVDQSGSKAGRDIVGGNQKK